MNGFSNITFSPVEFQTILHVLSNFQFLDKYPENVYIRGQVELSSTEIDNYHNALNIPYDSDDSYYRILEPITLLNLDGIFYIINGNSRIKFLALKIAEGVDPADVSPIPYRVIQSDSPLTSEQIVKLQIAANDTTRRHKAIETFSKIVGYVESLKNRGILESQARKNAAKYFAVSQQTLSDAIKVMGSEEILIELINSETCTTDAASLIITASEKVGLSIQKTLEAICSPNPVGDIKIKASMVKTWRKKYEKENGTRESRIDNLIESNKVTDDGIVRLRVNADDSDNDSSEVMPEAREIDLDSVIDSVNLSLSSPVASDKNFRVLGGILSVLPSKVIGDKDALFSAMLEMVSLYATPETLNPADLEALSKALTTLETPADSAEQI